MSQRDVNRIIHGVYGPRPHFHGGEGGLSVNISIGATPEFIGPMPQPVEVMPQAAVYPAAYPVAAYGQAQMQPAAYAPVMRPQPAVMSPADVDAIIHGNYSGARPVTAVVAPTAAQQPAASQPGAGAPAPTAARTPEARSSGDPALAALSHLDSTARETIESLRATDTATPASARRGELNSYGVDKALDERFTATLSGDQLRQFSKILEHTHARNAGGPAAPGPLTRFGVPVELEKSFDSTLSSTQLGMYSEILLQTRANAPHLQPSTKPAIAAPTTPSQSSPDQARDATGQTKEDHERNASNPFGEHVERFSDPKTGQGIPVVRSNLPDAVHAMMRNPVVIGAAALVFPPLAGGLVTSAFLRSKSDGPSPAAQTHPSITGTSFSDSPVAAASLTTATAKTEDIQITPAPPDLRPESFRGYNEVSKNLAVAQASQAFPAVGAMASSILGGEHGMAELSAATPAAPTHGANPLEGIDAQLPTGPSSNQVAKNAAAALPKPAERSSVAPQPTLARNHTPEMEPL